MNDLIAAEVRRAGAVRAATIGPSEIDPAGLLGRILESEPVGTGPRRPRAVVRWRLGLAGLAVAAGLGIALLAFGGGGGVPLAPPSATATLREFALAASAHREQEPPLEPGQFFYRRTQGYGSVGQVWTNRQGGGAYTSTRDTPGIHRIRHGGDRVYLGHIPLGYERMLALPRSPGALLEVVEKSVLNDRQRSGPLSLHSQQRMFRAIEDFLVSAPAPADLKGAFYRALAKLDYVHLIGPTRNQAGRQGIAVGMWFNGGPDTDEVVTAADGTVLNERDDLIFDPRTGALIGTRTVLNGEVQGMAVETGVVDRIGEVPRDDSR